MIIYKFTKKVVWKGINQHQCAKDLSVPQGNLSSCLHLKIKSVKGYIFRFVDQADVTWYRQGNRKKVQNMDTGEVFESSMEAGRKYNIAHRNIRKAANGERKQAGGYTWRLV